MKYIYLFMVLNCLFGCGVLEKVDGVDENRGMSVVATLNYDTSGPVHIQIDADNKQSSHCEDTESLDIEGKSEVQVTFTDSLCEGGAFQEFALTWALGDPKVTGKIIYTDKEMRLTCSESSCAKSTNAN